MIRYAALIFAFALVSGCAWRGAAYTPLVDSKGRSSAELNINISECQQYANQRGGAGEGAVAGAVVGALVGAAIGHKSAYQGILATQGAIVGAGAGALGAYESQEMIIKRCLAGRGFNVLN